STASTSVRGGSVYSATNTPPGMHRSMELTLGLPPMSQYDAAAAPMYGSFQPTPVLTPFTHREARVSLDEKNDASAPGAAASMAMECDEPDRAPDLELNEIIWSSVKGPASSMPPPVRAAFIRPTDADRAAAATDRK